MADLAAAAAADLEVRYSFELPGKTLTDGEAFDTGPQFVFNMGGGPGIRVHQFGGARPRRRPREAQEGEERAGGFQNLIGLLPILFFFILPLLSSLFSGDSSASTPQMTFDNPKPPLTAGRQTPKYKFDYFVEPKIVQTWSSAKLGILDKTAEVNIIRYLQDYCEHEVLNQQRLRDDAMGWISVDKEKMAKANAYPKPNCDRLDKLGLGYRR